ncbi:unnamed protein product [Eretmochelys imbricata]
MENRPRNVTGSESSETVTPQAPAGITSPRPVAEEPLEDADRAASQMLSTRG